MVLRRRELLSEKQVAAALRTDVAALQRMRSAGIGPAYRVGPDGQVWYSPGAVQGWLIGSRPRWSRPHQ
ncbi:MAG: hypothetical protein M3O28_00130 [Actinomycetota bacterium]|nr:hypothetical protein [Actinomycetota bacterium]